MCSAFAEEAAGSLHHPNLVVICALYISRREKKLLAHTFYTAGSLRRFLQGLFPFTPFVYLSVGIPLLGFTAGFEILPLI
jgi:hypothetical protein